MELRTAKIRENPADETRMITRKQSIPIGRPHVLRHTNALSILTLLRDCGSCSRADLVRATGLSAPTVTNVVRDLLSKNLVEPLGEGASNGGRPPDKLRFKAERGCILAVAISTENLSLLLTDLNGNQLDILKTTLTRRRTTPAAICSYIADAIERLLRRQKKIRKQLLALVVAVPAIANAEEGSVLSISPFQEWRAVPLRAMLNKIVDCPIIVENDTNLAALGERYCGAAQTTRRQRDRQQPFLHGSRHQGPQLLRRQRADGGRHPAPLRPGSGRCAPRTLCRTRQVSRRHACASGIQARHRKGWRVRADEPVAPSPACWRDRRSVSGVGWGR